jgi:CheY-like chemotaxis protein
MGKKILLADDSITIQKVIELTFSDEDFEVVTVGNGRLAIEKVADIRPDIVLCDIIMPEKDGYEVCEHVKKHPSLAHVPVLLLTGAFEPFDQERAHRVGADGSLAKPFEPETLIAKVKELLKKAAAASWPSGRPAVPRPADMPPVTAPVKPTEPARTQAFPTFATPPPRPAVVPTPPAPPPVPSAPHPVGPAPAAAAPPSAPRPQPATYDSGPQTFIAEPVLTPEPDVRFIPDEPFGVLDADSFTEEAGTTGPGAAPSTPRPAESLGEDLYARPEEQITPELIEVTPEESESLATPPPAADGASTIMFKADALPWAQPTGEVPLVERARAAAESIEAAEEPVLEEVFEEEAMTTLPSLGAVSSATPRPPAPPAPASSPRHERTIASSWETYQPPPTGEPVSVRAPEPPSRAPEPAPRAFEPVPRAFEPVPRAPEPVVRAPEPPPRPAEPPMRPLEPPPRTLEMVSPSPPPAAPPPAEPPAPPAARVEPPPVAPVPVPNPASFADLTATVREVVKPAVSSIAAEVAVPVDMVEKIAQRVVAQISEKVIQQIAWEVIPDLAEAMIKKEIERLKAELQQT